MRNDKNNVDNAPELQDEITKLKTKNSELNARVSELEALVSYYEEALRKSRQDQYGASSEKTEIPEQLGLFDEAENTADHSAPEEVTTEEITYTRKKRVGKREEDISKLPIEKVEYELSEEERTCPECDGSMHVMSKEIRNELCMIPAQVYVKQHIQYVYSCRNCERTGIHTPIVTAHAPKPVIKGSLASPSSAANIIVEKYVKAVPLYRQEQQLKRDGVNLSRQTMANWIIKCSENWLKPLYDRMRDKLLQEEVAHADETRVQVLREPGKKARSESYMWLYRTSGDAKQPIVLYEYQPTRSSSHPKKFLADFKGYLHTDGYSGYHNLPPGITVVGCWAHARRKFDEALKSMPEKDRIGSKAAQGLSYCNRLFAIEREFEKMTPEERHKARLEKSLPLAEEFLSWAENLSLTVLPKSLLGKAAKYLREQWKWLKNIYLDGRLELSNNRAERSIKPFVIGRKNWLFCSSQKGAKASSVVYSIIETAKENGLKPFEYLEFLFETMPNSNTGEIDSFLPWGDNVPDNCRMPE